MPKKAKSSAPLGEQRDLQRGRLFDRLRQRHSTMTPQAAEEEAARLGCGPLAHSPPAECFDPMQQTHWTFLMALAWVIFRNPSEVRSVNNDYLAECSEFRSIVLRDPEDASGRRKGRVRWELSKLT